MAKVFISYSRKDIEFAKRLTGELQKSELDFWIDWKGIPPTVDWWREIEKGIEEADVFLFLISPDSAKSKICGQEIDTAVKNGKRIIPAVVREIQWEDTPPKLGHLNYIFFSRDESFDAAVQKLLTAIHTDYEWAATHRRLQVKALEWQRKNKENSLLLRGKDLQEAEFQLTANSSKEPYPTDLLLEHVSASRSAEDRQHWLSRRSRVIISIIGVVLLAIIGLAMTGIFNRFIYRPVDMEDYWVIIPAGKFLMGSSDEQIAKALKLCSYCVFSDEQPQHWVDLPEYQIGKYEITNRQYAQCAKAGVCAGKAYATDTAFHPVVNVTWYDAKTYCEWAGVRLPTEAEWEKAASWDDGTKTKRTYPWGETMDCSYANYNGKDGGNDFCVGETTPVGSYESGKSPYGLYDIAGNVWEWVSSLYMFYPYLPDFGREDMSLEAFRVLRGGSWTSVDYSIRSALRRSYDPANSDQDLGFRCARDSSP